jgi:hypothetical protein
LQLAQSARVRVFSRPTLVGDSLWVPYGTDAQQLRAACERAASATPLAAVFCHADIVGGMMNEGVAATQGLPPDAFPPLPTRVYSGHYHKPHVVAEPTARGRHIQYAGSPYQTSMAEAGQRKALLVLDRTKGWAVDDEIELDLGPRHHVCDEPSAEDLTALAGGLRQGDRVLVLSDAPEASTVTEFSREQRKRGVSVEVREPMREGSAAAAASSAAGPALDLLQPKALFTAYAEAKNLSSAARQAATELVDAAQAQEGFAQACPLHIELSHVSLEGFGSFAERVQYPLA